MKLHDLNSLPGEQMNELVFRQVVHSGQMTVSKLALKTGAVVPLHHHVNEQLSIVLRGRFRFEFPEATVEVCAGQIMEIAPNLPHRVEVLEDCDVIDMFAPPREDWKRGDDQYLRQGR
jgi:quercetin dioxygenase-like cupin family protein